jgi:flavin-dependent dehydrogenase/CRP-like cAMP-binding protein
VTRERLAGRFPGLVSSLGEGDVDALLDALELRDADAGEALVAEGTPSDRLFLVLEGTLDVTVDSRVVAEVEPGAYFGEVSLFDPGPAGASIVTEQGAVVLQLGRERLEPLVDEHPEAAAALLWEAVHSLEARVRRAGGTVETLHVTDSPQDALAAGEKLAREFREVTLRVRERIAVGAESTVKEYDVVVIGAGPHALAYATWIKQDRPQTRIALVEKRAAPGFKIGESTLGPVVRAGLQMGVQIPVWRRLFNNKLGLHFWWIDEGSDELHTHFDAVVEETFQLERRVFELLMLSNARRAGVDVYQGTRASIEDSRIEGQPKELVCETDGGDVIRFRSSVLCDASGPAAVIGRHLGLRRKNRDFNTNAYWGYFQKKAEVGLETWDVPATRHLCFPQGWAWFIELASWERASDDRLQAMIDHLLDVGDPNEGSYPTMLELSQQFDCPVDLWPISIGVVPRTDIDSAADLPLEDRFGHYVDRYPVFKRIMDTYDLIEEPYDGHPSYIAYTEITQHSDRYAGDGWLLLGDAAYFVNPYYSPGLTYGHSLASFAAKETVAALEAGDFSEQAFAKHDDVARRLYKALVSECEVFYRSWRSMEAYERAQLFRVAFHVGLQYERLLKIGGIRVLPMMRPMRPPPTPVDPVMNPRYNEVLARLIDAMREVEERGGGPDETTRAVREIIDPLIEEVGSNPGVHELHIGDGFRYYDDQLRRVPGKPDWQSLVPTWRCARCANNPPVQFEACYVCGEPAPPGLVRPAPPQFAPAPAGPR